ncbi:hypothetical protein COO91_03054 [Nostoc flagelliforme CCNUN1]|uniref:Uncharacterized protein n=1 Tax=Nostoc flagelliforme CCNUN1 TaxID=2038116 RepID=A0A2K8SNY6_9NOSO|nr:hypothetical protein COO91_03054 [Nostoc flagelliforme CCNUN1]
MAILQNVSEIWEYINLWISAPKAKPANEKVEAVQKASPSLRPAI